MSASIRRRTNSRHQSAENDALVEVAKEAEARLAAKRAARMEAREIRMRELERQQIEDQEKERRKNSTEANKYNSYSNYSSRKLKEYSNSDDIKTELSELQDKYSRSMSDNARLDNDKQGLKCRIDDLADQLDELKEAHIDVNQRLTNKKKELEQEHRKMDKLVMKETQLMQMLDQKDALIKEHGLVFISDDVSDHEKDGLENGGGGGDGGDVSKKCALVSPEALAILEEFSGSMDQRILRMDEEIKARDKLIRKLKKDLDEERDKKPSHSPTPTKTTPKPPNNNNTNSSLESELVRQVDDYRFKLKKSNQDVISLEDTISRLEKQVKRHKSSVEAAEKGEEEIKGERRLLQKEVRSLKMDKETVEMENERLLKRIDKLHKH